MAQQGSSYRWGVGATLVILAMSLALACSSDPDPKKGGGGSAPPGCATLCAGFSQGLNCTASAQGQCLDGCSDDLFEA